MFTNNESNLFIVAHPDDELFGVGATILRTAHQGDRNSIILCTTIMERTDAFVNSCRDLGILHVYHLRLPAFQASVQEFHAALDEALPCLPPIDNVFTHNRTDIHQDHRNVHDAAFLAFRPWAWRCRNFLTFETYDSSNTNYSDFKPNVFVDVSGSFMEKKLNLLQMHYPSELKNGREIPSVVNHMARYGAMSAPGTQHCEAFQLIRSII